LIVALRVFHTQEFLLAFVLAFCSFISIVLYFFLDSWLTLLWMDSRRTYHILPYSSAAFRWILFFWSYNKVRKLIAVKMLHTSLLNTTVVAFNVLPLGSYAPIPAPSPSFKTILELVLWNGLQSCRCITSDVINVIKMPPFHISFIFMNRKKSLGATSGE